MNCLTCGDAPANARVIDWDGSVSRHLCLACLETENRERRRTYRGP